MAMMGAAALALAGCGTREEEKATDVPPVVVELSGIEQSDEAVPVHVTGIVSRKDEAELSFKIPGIVETVAVRAGDEVEVGQELARLRLDEIDAQVTQARNAVEKAERDLVRVERLQAGAVATLENLQDARTGVEQARAQLRIAEFNRRFAVIVAPAKGRILRRSVEPNEIVSAGKAAVVFAPENTAWLLRAGVADTELQRVRIGDGARVRLGDGNVAEGRVAQIAGAAEAQTRTTTVEIEFEADAPMRSGLVVSGTVQPQTVAKRAVVPATALIEGDASRASLFLVEDGSDVARRVEVEVETIDGGRVYLRTALADGASVVVRGGEFLRDGDRVVAAKR